MKKTHDIPLRAADFPALRRSRRLRAAEVAFWSGKNMEKSPCSVRKINYLTMGDFQ